MKNQAILVVNTEVLTRMLRGEWVSALPLEIDNLDDLEVVAVYQDARRAVMGVFEVWARSERFPAVAEKGEPIRIDVSHWSQSQWRLYGTYEDGELIDAIWTNKRPPDGMVEVDK